MDRIDFLLARNAEEEKAALEARDENPDATWLTERRYDGVYSLSLPSTHADSDSYGLGADLLLPREMAKHIAHHDPTTVLARCKAVRRIVEFMRGGFNTDDVEYWTLHEALEYLTMAYAGHPDFDQSWRP